jgi:hypothetical protein
MDKAERNATAMIRRYEGVRQQIQQAHAYGVEAGADEERAFWRAVLADHVRTARPNITSRQLRSGAAFRGIAICGLSFADLLASIGASRTSASSRRYAQA